jgi:hypothetical protein
VGRAGLVACLFTPKNAPTSANGASGSVLPITSRVIDSAHAGAHHAGAEAVWERAASEGEKQPRLVIRVDD